MPAQYLNGWSSGSCNCCFEFQSVSAAQNCTKMCSNFFPTNLHSSVTLWDRTCLSRKMRGTCVPLVKCREQEVLLSRIYLRLSSSEASGPSLAIKGKSKCAGKRQHVLGILWIKQLIYWMKLHAQKMKKLSLTPIGSSNGMVITMANKRRIQMPAASLLSPYCSSFKSRIQWFHNPIFADIFSSVPPLYLPTGSRSLYASAI